MTKDLFIAAGDGKIDTVKTLLKKHPENLNLRFHLKFDDAASHSDNFKILIERQFDTALTKSIKKRHSDISIELLRQKNICTEIEENNGSHYVGGFKTALAIACAYNSRIDVFKALLQKTRDINTGLGGFNLPELIMESFPDKHEAANRLNLLHAEAVKRADCILGAAIHIVADKNQITLNAHDTNSKTTAAKSFSNFCHLFKKSSSENASISSSHILSPRLSK